MMTLRRRVQMGAHRAAGASAREIDRREGSIDAPAAPRQ